MTDRELSRHELSRQRVGTAEREQVLGLLGKALEEGYLGLDEYEQRMVVVTAATTASELTRQVADLPPRLRWEPRPAPAPEQPGTKVQDGHPRSPAAHVTAVASMVFGLVSLPLSICAGIGGLFGLAAAALSVPGLRSPRDRGRALVGLVTGLLGVALSLFMAALIFLTGD